MSLDIKKKIVELISKRQWIGINSITFADGKIVLMDLEYYSKGKYYIGPIADSTIESYLKYNKDNLSCFDVFSQDQNEFYKVLAGDGSGEGEGFVYLVNMQTGSLVWFAFFESSEPFKMVKLSDDGIVSAISTMGIEWKITITNPLEIALCFPDD